MVVFATYAISAVKYILHIKHLVDVFADWDTVSTLGM